MSGLLGAPSELPAVGALPTNKDILAAIEHEVALKEKEVSDAINHVRDELIKNYKEVIPFVPLISEMSISVKLKRLYETNKLAGQHKLKTIIFKNFKGKLDRIFDIIACQCEIISCGGGQSCLNKDDCDGFHAICSCLPANKIPDKEVSYVNDQRNKVGIFGGKMTVGRLDKKETQEGNKRKEKEEKKTKKAEKRAIEAAKVEENIKMMRKSEELLAPDVDYDFLEENLNENYEEEFTVEEFLESKNYTTIEIEVFVAELTRYGISHKAGAAVWNAVIRCLEKAGHLKNEDDTSIKESLIVDKYKVRRAKKKFARKQKAKKDEEVKDGIECIGTDGKRDRKTLQKETVTVNGVEHEKQFAGVEEHIVYTNEPDGGYLTHSTPDDELAVVWRLT